MTRNIKIILAIAFLLCLIDMPYWYYQLIRLFGSIGLAYLAYTEYKQKIKYFPIIYGAFALALQPLYKISFPRDIWNIIDVIIAIVLVFSLTKFSDRFTSSRVTKNG